MFATAGRGVLFVAMLAACLAARAEDAVQTTFDRLAKMSFAEQQAWLERLEQRSARAARLTLSTDEAAAQQAHVHALLHQKMVTWKALREAVEATDANEKKAIADLGSRFVARGGQRDAWTAAERDWQNAGRRFDDQDRLIDWLETALRGLAPKVEKKEEKTEVAKPEIAKPQAVKREVAKPQVAAPSEKSPAESVQVNVGELEARIAGSNLALREFETGLDEKGDWNAARLEPLAERLKILAIRRNDLDLLRELVPQENRAGIAGLESPKSAISQLSARVVEARNAANGPKFSGDDAERRAELSRLEKISRNMAELSGK